MADLTMAVKMDTLKMTKSRFVHYTRKCSKHQKISHICELNTFLQQHIINITYY